MLCIENEYVPDGDQAPKAKELFAADTLDAFPEIVLRGLVQQETDFAVLSVTAPGFTKEVTEELMDFVGSVGWRSIFCLNSPPLTGLGSKLDICKSLTPAALVVNASYRQIGVLDPPQHADEFVNKVLFIGDVRHNR